LLSNAAGAWFKNASGGLVGSDPSVGEVNYWCAQLERANASFAIVADCALIQLGGGLKRKEKLSGRFADVMGEMYLMSCALKRFEDDGRLESDLPVLELAFQDALFTVYERLHEIVVNLPMRPAAWFLRRLIFPWGRRWRRASDELGGQVADLLIGSRKFRERLCAGMYIDDSPDDIIGCLENAVVLAAVSEEAEDEIRSALKDGKIAPYSSDIIAQALDAGVIDPTEAEQLGASRAALRREIDVDDFSADETWGVRTVGLPEVNAAW